MNKRIVFAVAYIVVALIGYVLFVKYSLSKYEEERTILEAEYAAEGYDPRWFEYFFLLDSVHGRNLVWVGCILGLGSPFVILAMFKVVDMIERKKEVG